MIVKEHGLPLEVYRLEALERRLPSHHRMKEKVQLDLKRHKSGIRGEKEVDYPLRFLNEDRYFILHNLRLSDQNGYFQIDTLILSGNYILILEVKNWYGTITFGENGQVTRIGDNGVEEGFPNPIPQAKLQQHRLRNWLHAHGVTNIPIDFFVVISFPSTIIKSLSPEYPMPENVIHNSQLFFNIQALDKLYTTPKLCVNELQILSRELASAHTPSTINVLAKYGIAKNELIKGVICPKCSAVPMLRKRQKWCCIKCGCISDNAHLVALNDYKLLVGDWISNQEAREFLQIDSPYVAKHLLQKEKFDYVGRTSSRMYKLEYKYHDIPKNNDKPRTLG